MEVRLVVSIDTLVDFYMKNKEGEKDFEVMKTVDEQGNINSTMQDVIIHYLSPSIILINSALILSCAFRCLLRNSTCF